MVSLSETNENQSHQIQHNIQKHQSQQQQQQQQQQEQQQQFQHQLIKSIQLYHNQHNKIMSTKSSSSSSQEKQTPSTTGSDGNVKDATTKTIATEINKQTKAVKTTTTTTTTTVPVADGEENVGGIVTTAINITTTTKPPKSAVSQRSIEIEIEKSVSSKPRNLKLDLITNKSEDSVKSPKTPKTPKSPLSTAGRLSHQTSLSSQIDIVEDRKTLRDALYQGIFHRHRKTIFAMGSFLRMLRSRNSQYNTIRSSSEGEDIDDTR